LSKRDGSLVKPKAGFSTIGEVDFDALISVTVSQVWGGPFSRYDLEMGWRNESRRVLELVSMDISNTTTTIHCPCAI
jgi:hypothetical protein